jgi:ABC-type nitrate/sulfonate/bicarbonate transport system substrate-binding protein
MKSKGLCFVLFLILVSAGVIPGSGLGQEKIRIGVPLFPTVSFPAFIAHEKGFFEKNGLKAEIIRINSEPTTYQALISGDIDVTSGAPTGLSNRISRACRSSHSEVGTIWYRTPWRPGKRSMIFRS